MILRKQRGRRNKDALQNVDDSFTANTMSNEGTTNTTIYIIMAVAALWLI